jgi:hypothetical protein
MAARGGHVRCRDPDYDDLRGRRSHREQFCARYDAAVTAISDSKSPVRIGAYVGVSGGLSGFWNGSIDEVDVVHRALTSAEIQSIVASGSAGKSAVAGSIYVNLQMGTATGLAGGIANIHNAIGGAGNDILVGNGGNVLKGGAGRDLLIAGVTASILGGGADQDVLIGGAIVNSRPENLDAIMAEWAKTGAGFDYNSRVAILRANLLADGKISSNGGNNTLTGGDDALDFFFGSFVTDWQEGEDAVLV